MHAQPAGVSYPTDNQRTNTLNKTEKGWEVSERGTLGDTRPQVGLFTVVWLMLVIPCAVSTVKKH